MEGYEHKKIEEKWRKSWIINQTFKTEDEVEGKDNFYTLVEFPYPSGDLHVGHWYAFSITDIYAKFQRLLGKNVLFPIGFDSFGLPAENAAIKHGLDPKDWTYKNIETMKNQMMAMGNSFDWDRMIITSDPEYYKWTQWIFTQMFERNLAYKKKAIVNWDPVDKTVLANEQVQADGTAERSGAIVEKKEIDQWFLKITDYAERLTSDLDKLDWPNEIKEQQKNWIGKSNGAELTFNIKDSESEIKVFTTRPDTLFGASYLVISPENSLIKKLSNKISNLDDVKKYIDSASKKTEIDRTKNEKEKTGVILDGVSAINPVTKKEIPVFVADYVLGGYGTGAVMAVPAHDERDYAFAKKFGLDITNVIEPITGEPLEDEEKRKSIVALVENSKGEILSINWGNKLGGSLLIGGGREEGEDIIECAQREITEETGYKNIKFIANTELIHHHYRAHSKNVNREIEAFGLYFKLVDDEKIEQQLEEDEKDKFKVEWISKKTAETEINDPLHNYILNKFINEKIYTDYGFLVNSGDFNGLTSQEAGKKITEFVGGEMKTTFKLRDWSVGRQRYWGTPVPIVYDPQGKPHAVPKENLPWILPTDVDHTPTGESPLAKSIELRGRTEKIFGKGWTPEVETLDTFIDSSWYFIRYTDPKNSEALVSPDKEASWLPVDFYSGGTEHTTLHALYSRFFYKFLSDIGIVSNDEPYKYRLNRGLILGTDGNKMSKSKGNTINPDELVERLGADTVRLYLAFIGPYNEPGSYPWDQNGVVGVRRFLEKVWRVSKKNISDTSSPKVILELNKLIKKARNDYTELKFNTVVAGMMSFMNVVEKESISREDFLKFVIVISPSAPYISEELFNLLSKSKKSVFDQSMPDYDESVLLSEQKKIGVQVNGKIRAEIGVFDSDNEESIKEKVLSLEEIKKHTKGKELVKFIYIPSKIISIVLR